jgi:hypothetical protein
VAVELDIPDPYAEPKPKYSTKLDVPDPYATKLDVPDPYAAAPPDIVIDPARPLDTISSLWNALPSVPEAKALPPVTAADLDPRGLGGANIVPGLEATRFLPEVQRAGLGGLSQLAMAGAGASTLVAPDVPAIQDPLFRAADYFGDKAAAIAPSSPEESMMQMPLTGIAGMFGGGRGREVVKAGGTVEQGVAGTGIEAGQNLSSLLVPYLGKSLVSRLLMQTAAAPAIAEVGRRASNELLPESMHQEYSPTESILAALGAAPFAFGGGHGGAEPITPRDMARAAESRERADVNPPPPEAAPLTPEQDRAATRDALMARWQNAATPEEQRAAAANLAAFDYESRGRPAAPPGQPLNVTPPPVGSPGAPDTTAIKVEPAPVQPVAPEPAPVVEPPVTPVEARAPEPVQPAAVAAPTQLPLPLEAPGAKEAAPVEPPVAAGREPVPRVPGGPDAAAEGGGTEVATEPVTKAATEPVAPVGQEPAPPPLITPEEAKAGEPAPAAKTDETPAPAPEGKPAEPAKTDETILATKDATTKQREDRGASVLPPDTPHEWHEADAKAKDRIAQDPNYASNLANEVVKSKRPIDDVESMALLNHRVDLQNRFDEATRAIAKALDEGDKGAEIKGRLERAQIENALETNERAAQHSKSAVGRSLNATKAGLTRDFSLAHTIARAKVAYRGKWGESTRATIERLTKELEAQKAIAEGKGKGKTKAAGEGKAGGEAKPAPPREPKPKQTPDERMQARLKKEISKHEDQIAARLKACPIP